MEGFNNFEQGILIACAVFSTFSLMWIAIVSKTPALLMIDVAHHLKRIAEAINKRHDDGK